MKYCPECGSQLPNETIKFCPECGFKLSSQTKSDYNIVCPDCKTKIKDENSDCPNCGCPSSLFKEVQIPQKHTSELEQTNDQDVICPDCGLVMEKPIPAECPSCGCPSSAFQEQTETPMDKNISPSLESSNNFGAEHTVNGLAGLNLTIGIIVGIVGVIAAIVFWGKAAGDIGFTQIYMLIGVLCFIFSLLFFLICLLAWAFLKLLVNISYRLTRLDNKYNPK